MGFEFDPQKSETNKAKHGIDFVEAQTLWKSRHVLLPAKDVLEKRYMVIGRIRSQYWSAIISYRGATIRIISVRKSTPLEIDTYEKKQADVTTAKNLEERFDRSEEVLDYFEVTKARVINPRSNGSTVKKFAYPAKRNSDRRAAVREKSARYRKK